MGWTQVRAAGFNAWGQAALVPSSRPHNSQDNLRTWDEPDDLESFTQVQGSVAKDVRNIESFLSYTLTTTSSCTTIYGKPSPEQRTLHTLPQRASYRLIAQAGNGKISVLDHDGNIRTYESPQKLLGGTGDCNVFPGFSDVTQLVAYEVGFAALDSNGRVWTWGDERFPHCLGREVPTVSSAHSPGQVSDLDDLPTGKIVKIAANGYTLGAMTDGGDLYCCGGHPAQIPIIEGLDNIPNLVDIRGKGVVDFGIGSLHMIVLTDDGRVMVIGNNTNGQLGIAAEKATTWTEVPLGLGEDSTVIAVRAGPRTSFVIIEGDRQVEDLSESAEEDGAP